MAAIASNAVVSLRKPLSCPFASNSSLLGNKFLGKSLSVSTPMKRSDTARFSGLAPINASSHSFDVVVVGAGIIGLSIARQFLLQSDLSVALVDAAVPCSGATGAGQGYLWMVHKAPGNDKWELAMRSRKLWEKLAENVQHQGMNPLEILGWKKTDVFMALDLGYQVIEDSSVIIVFFWEWRDPSMDLIQDILVEECAKGSATSASGSLLVGRSPKESAMLKRRVDQLSEAGLRAEFLSSCDLLLEEPELMVGEEGGAAFLPDDCQLDAQCTVAFIEKVNRHFATEGRYAEFYNEPATSLLRSGSGEVVAVQTSKNTLYSKKAVVIAAGCWSGSLMHDLIRDSDIVLDVPVKPRKGHLLVLEKLNSIKLNHGLMEMGYVDHEASVLDSSDSASGPVHAQTASVSMTATMDAWGNLVLGSSRQFVGFSTEIDESIINRIWERAGEFFPALREFSLRDLRESREVRIGLRPYMPDGKPVIGPVPGLSNLFLAAGHEGEGLSLALGTAEMVANMVLGNPGKVDHAPFALESRCCMLR